MRFSLLWLERRTYPKLRISGTEKGLFRWVLRRYYWNRSSYNLDRSHFSVINRIRLDWNLTNQRRSFLRMCERNICSRNQHRRLLRPQQNSNEIYKKKKCAINLCTLILQFLYRDRFSYTEIRQISGNLVLLRVRGLGNLLHCSLSVIFEQSSRCGWKDLVGRTLVGRLLFLRTTRETLSELDDYWKVASSYMVLVTVIDLVRGVAAFSAWVWATTDWICCWIFSINLVGVSDFFWAAEDFLGLLFEFEL